MTPTLVIFYCDLSVPGSPRSEIKEEAKPGDIRAAGYLAPLKKQAS